MFNLSHCDVRPASRRAAVAALTLCLALPTIGCGIFGVKQKILVPPLLTPLASANTDELMSQVNRLSGVRSIRGKVDIEFLDTSFAESGVAEKYRTADGTVTLARPGMIYLLIQGPFSVDIAQMASDGTHFSVAVLKGDEQYRRFVRGTNSADYSRFAKGEEEESRKRDGKNKAKAEKRAVNALSNLRPQHFTEALLIRPITPRSESGYVYTQSEVYRDEKDPKPGAKSSSRVVRGYYLLDELALEGSSGARLVRRFWFDRVGEIRLSRLQTYEDGGKLVTDVVYSQLKSFGADGRVQLPSHIELTRPQDRYKLALTYQSPPDVVLDTEYKPSTFVLENKWQLPEVDLDARRDKGPKTSQ